MAINFPSSPASGDTFTSEGRTFRWNGAVWVMDANDFPWATVAEALAGVRADRVMSPGLTAARIAAIGANPSTAHPFSGTPTNLAGSRSQGVAYQNTFDRPMVLAVCATIQLAILTGATAGALARFCRNTNSGAGRRIFNFALIPPFWWYRVDTNGALDPTSWVEYR